MDYTRKKILEILKNNEDPVKGTDLASMIGISRQAIVQHIAILRASGVNVIATHNGYIIPNIEKRENRIKSIECTHSKEEIREELEIIIDLGGKIIDVTIEHPVYGEIVCSLLINSRYELEKFLESLTNKNGKPLLFLTDGIHRHTIEVPNEEVYEIMIKKLTERGFLINLE
jgi:transcriptional regulator of NAD metabolism